MKKSPSHESGFSLVELMIICVVIAVLAAMALVAMMTALDRAKQRGTMADMRTIGKAVEAYQTDTGFYPSNGQTIIQLASYLRPSASSVIPTEDHWNHPYIYSSDNLTHYSIESYGKDGIDGANIDYNTRYQFDLDMVFSDGVFVASPEN